MRDLSQIKQGNFKLYDKVAIGGVTVTKHNKYGFFVQNSNNNYAGIYVFTDENQPKPPVDSFINLKSARVQKFYRQIQLFEAIWEVIKPNTKPKISNISLKQAAGTVEEPLNQKSPYEGMLVKLSDSELTVTKIENFGEDEEAKKQILTINNLINFSPTDTTNKTYKIGDKITLPAGVLAWRFGKLELLN